MDLCFCFLHFFSLVCCSTFLLFFLICSIRRRRRFKHLENNKKTWNYYFSGYNISMSNIVHNLMERLRPLVGMKGWDYCVLWKLSDDQRFIEWMDCCCAGTDQNMINGGDEELHFPVSAVLPCRDVAFHHQHPRTKSCELLAQLASSMPFDTGNIYAQTLLSNQPRWLNFSNNTSDSEAMEETIWTRVLIPVMGGLLIELFVTKEVPEDLNVIDFVAAQCRISFHDDQEATMTNTNNNNNTDQNDLFPPAVSLSTALDNLDHVPYDISVDRIRLSNSTSTGSPMNLLHQFYSTTTSDQNNGNQNDHHVFFEESSLPDHHDHNSFLSHHHLDRPINMMNSLINSSSQYGVHQENMDVQYMDQEDQQQGNNVNDNDKDSFNKPENGRSDSVSDCSDQIDDEDDGKYRRRNGKGPHSKNLVAERKRRKKLNDRLYALRALVPKISKLDRASILGDAIEFVKELQKQAKELQDELEEHSDDDGAKSGGINNVNNNNNVKSEIFSQNGTTFGPKTELDHHKSTNGFHLGASGTGNSIPKQDLEISNDKAQQMEVQVEVAQLDGNEFFVKVFCEHKPGGFVRLIEALNSLGLEVTNANVTSFRGLVSNVFKVEKRDSEMVQADHVRDSLLELTRNPNPSRGWPDQMGKASESINGNVDFHNHHQHHHHHDHHLHNHHIAAHHLHRLHN